MNIQCKISGIEYAVADCFGSQRLHSIHPAFELPIKYLFNRTGDWAANRLNEQERKLMFLSLLFHTDLVHFKTPAFPSDKIVQQNMEHVIKIVSWILAIKTPALVLPQFVITNETREMLNVKHWLDTWDEARKDFDEGYKSQTHLAKMRNREYALERLIKNAQRKVEDYSGLLSSWAFEAAAVPAELHEEWRKIFLAKGITIYSLRKADIEELVEHMEEHLEHGSIYANAVLRHVRLIQAKNKQGLAFGLGMLDNEYQDIDLEAMIKDPFKIVTDTVEGANIDAAISTAPTECPVSTDYPSKVAYFRAKIKWEMAEKARAYADEFTTQVETQLAIDEELNSSLSSDDNINDAESGNSADLAESEGEDNVTE